VPTGENCERQQLKTLRTDTVETKLEVAFVEYLKPGEL
jgi:hypothetical protein